MAVTLPSDAVGEVRLTLQIPRADGKAENAQGYAFLRPYLPLGTRYRASNVEGQVAARTRVDFDSQGRIRDPLAVDEWPKVLASNAPGATIDGLQWVLEFHIANVEQQPADVIFTVPAKGFTNVGLLVDTNPLPQVQQVLVAEAPVLAAAAATEQRAAEVRAVVATTDGLVASALSDSASLSRKTIDPVVTAALAGFPNVTAAATAAVSTAVANLKVVEQFTTGDDAYVKAWVDANDRIALGIRADGTVVIPLLGGVQNFDISKINGIEQLTASEEATGYWYALTDSAGTIAEPLAVALDGNTPQWVLDRWVQRMKLPATSLYQPGYAPIASRPLVSGPDINAIGDSMTAGAGGNGTTYATTLATLSGRTVRNNGVGGESSPTITARMGGYPFEFTMTGGVIPAAATAAQIALRQVDGAILAPLMQGGGGPGFVILNDGRKVAGTMTRDGNGVYYFTRSVAGAEIATTRPLRFYRDDAIARQGDIYIIWIGQNGPSNTRAIQDAKALIRSMRAAEKRYLILSKPTSTDAEDAEWFREFGDRFIPIRRYLIEFGLGDAGISPTAQDNTDIANGVVPLSLRVDAVHWNASGYTILGQQIYKRMIELNWMEPKA